MFPPPARTDIRAGSKVTTVQSVVNGGDFRREPANLWVIGDMFQKDSY